ncbi:BrnT family toxin [bacterium]|nr:BrnT family toxin [bacterium]
MSLLFNWDRFKEEINKKKHRVDFHEAATVFSDNLAAIIEDPDHSVGENRFLIIGVSILFRVLVVAYTERNGHIRIISARLATKKERKQYEEGRIR